MAEGNRDKTQPSCNSSSGGKCNCQPSYRVRVWIPEDGARRTRTFTGKGALSAAKNWRTDASKAVKDGKLRASTRQTLREAVDEFLEGAEAGAIRKRGGGTYKPAVIRNYRSALNRHVLPKLGDRRLDSITTSSCGRIWSCRPPGRPTDPRPRRRPRRLSRCFPMATSRYGPARSTAALVAANSKPSGWRTSTRTTSTFSTDGTT